MQAAHAPVRGGRFLGSYQHQLDEKGRVSLPASFRREAADQRFVLVQPYPPALALYPELEWLKVEDRLSELMGKDADARLYVLSIMANAVEVVVDAQGRILIPQRLKEAAELDGQVLLVGAIDKVELWNPDGFERAVTASTGRFDRFAPQIFR
ncbi:MAG: division/cell wall cluster transcriptional repressor MraZ [Longimicrobiales bacterium]